MNTRDEFQKKIKNYIDKNRLLDNIQVVVVGVSGGADSVCLFNILNRLKDVYGYKIIVVHVNHCIRGEAANEDETYVRGICEANNVEFHAFKKEVQKIAIKLKISDEEAGRMVRYEAFNEICDNTSESVCIAVAHNMNDTCETMLFNMFRGSGLRGMAGISTINNNIIRPLLCVSREEIEAYLNECNIEFRIDKTNLEEEYTRNKIRLNILSYVKENINNQAIRHMALASERIREADDFIEEYVAKRFKQIAICCGEDNNISCVEFNIKELKKEKSIIKRRLIRVAFFKIAKKLKDIGDVHVSDVLALIDMQVGRRISLPYQMIAYSDYHSIVISKNIAEIKTQHLNIQIECGKEYYLDYLDMYLSFTIKKYEKNEIIPKNNYTKWFDYDKIYNVILLRNREIGDYFAININGKVKKLKDYYIDSKINQKERDSIPLIADGQHVMWIIGYRTSEAYRVDEHTKHILEVNLYRRKL